MPQKTLNDNERGDSFRKKLNDNFTELYAVKHAHDNADSINRLSGTEKPLWNDKPWPSVGGSNTTGVLFLSRHGDNALLTHEMPTTSQQITDRQWINANWGEWTEIASFVAADDVADKEVEFIPGNRFFAKLWLSSDIERPNAQLRLEAVDTNDGSVLAVATSTVNLLNINSILTPVVFENKYQILRVLPLTQIRTTLSIMVLAQGVQVGITSNVPNEISYIAPISTGELGIESENFGAASAFALNVGEEKNDYEEIAVLRAQLAQTNSEVVEYLEGLITNPDYEPIRAKRQLLRDKMKVIELRNIAQAASLDDMTLHQLKDFAAEHEIDISAAKNSKVSILAEIKKNFGT